jgi:SAM-dependent methyltransferase
LSEQIFKRLKAVDWAGASQAESLRYGRQECLRYVCNRPHCHLPLCPVLDYCPEMSEASGFTVKPAEELAESEAKEAKRYWSSLAVPDFYKKPETHWSSFIAEQVLRLKPRSVLEFGCNVGRNLSALRELAPDVVLKGIDINAEAVAFGRQERGLDLLHADETFLGAQADNSLDVIFTVSVLDHLPNPKPVLADMVRVARSGVLLLEPSLEEEGKVLKTTGNQPDSPSEATPFSYSWDYARLANDLPVELSKWHYPLSGTLLGPYYWLFRLIKRAAGHPRA